VKEYVVMKVGQESTVKFISNDSDWQFCQSEWNELSNKAQT